MALPDQTTEGRQAFATLFHSDGGNSLIQKFHTSCASFLTKKYRTHQWSLQGVPTQTAIERLAMTVTRKVRRPRQAIQSPQRTGGGPSTPARRAGEGSVCTYLVKKIPRQHVGLMLKESDTRDSVRRHPGCLFLIKLASGEETGDQRSLIHQLHRS